MNMNNSRAFNVFKKKILPKIVLGYITVTFVLGGLGISVDTVQYLGFLVGACLVLFTKTWKEKVFLPPHFSSYLLFLLFFLLSLQWSVDTNISWQYLVFFVSGGLFWLASYNFKKETAKTFDKLIIGLGFFFAGLYFINQFFGDPNLIRSWSLYVEFSAYRNHNNIGDLWAVIIPLLLYYLAKKPRDVFLWLGIAFGIYLLYISQSRAAYVAVVAGVGYLAYVMKYFEKYKKPILAILLTVILMFLITGLQKPILGSRHYYFQGIAGIVKNPKGYGVGNFGVISRNPENHLFGMSGFSMAAHNIVLEILAGMGIYGLTFVYWFYQVLRELYSGENKSDLIYKTVFLTLTVNFFFHVAYFVPTMLWIWFVSLGLSQKRG